MLNPAGPANLSCHLPAKKTGGLVLLCLLRLLRESFIFSNNISAEDDVVELCNSSV